MASLASERATNLRSAYRICDLQPLEGEDLKYYADLGAVRKSPAISNVSKRLDWKLPDDPLVIWFTGHRGCGKSTELRRLETDWQKDYHVVYIETDEVVDINDIEYTDIYLLVVQYVEYELRKLGIQIDQGIIQDFGNWFKEITEETEETVEKSISIQGEVTLGLDNPIIPIPFLAKILAKLTSQIKGGATTKTKIRQVLEKDISRLKTSINLILDDAAKKLRKKLKNDDHKGVLIILDNLDRCPSNVADRLFINYATQLQELRCTMIYTMPISILYSPRGLSNSFEKPEIVPMINIYQYDVAGNPLKLNNASLVALVGLVEKRMDISKIFADQEQLLEIIRASGGHIRHLMQMIREACLKASSNGQKMITTDDATYAIKQLQFDFERKIPDDNYGAIVDTYQKKKVANNAIGQENLFNTSVLEYNGDRRWNYPHPVVIKIDAFQQVLTKSLTP